MMAKALRHVGTILGTVAIIASAGTLALPAMAATLTKVATIAGTPATKVHIGFERKEIALGEGIADSGDRARHDGLDSEPAGAIGRRGVGSVDYESRSDSRNALASGPPGLSEGATP